MLTTDDLLAAPIRRTLAVHLPVRGKTAYVRGLLAVEAMQFANSLDGIEGEAMLAAQLAAFLSDDKGNALLTLDQAQIAVRNLYPEDLRALLKAGAAFNTLSDESLEAAAKN